MTGAFGALGSAVARAFARTGARLALIDVAQPSAEMQAEFGASGHLLLPGADLADVESTRKAMAAIAMRFGGIDVLVNIAGGFRWEKIGSGDIATWDSLYSMNLRSAVVSSKSALPAMLERGRGRIINIGAGAAGKAGLGMGAYAASKAGVQRFTEALAEELKDRASRSMPSCPGIIDTPRNRIDMPQADFSRWVSPEAIAQVILFLASDAAGAVTGAAIPVTRPRLKPRDPVRVQRQVARVVELGLEPLIPVRAVTSPSARSSAVNTAQVGMLSICSPAESWLAHSVMPGLWPNTMTCAASPPSSRTTSMICAGLGQVKPLVLRDAFGGHLELACHDAGRRQGAHGRARQDQVRLELACAQPPRHLGRVLLAPPVEHAIPVLLAGQAEVRLGVPHQRQAVQRLDRLTRGLDSLDLLLLSLPRLIRLQPRRSRRPPGSGGCGPARTPAASVPGRCAGRIERHAAGR